MSKIRTFLLAALFFIIVICICLQLQSYNVKADAAISKIQGVSLRSATIGINKSIVVSDKKEVTEVNNSDNKDNVTYSRGETSNAQGSSVKLLQYAYSFIGTPYVYGASGSKAFDCSGFTSYVYRSLGIELPHSAAGQASFGKNVSKGSLAPGDLIFFAQGGGISHVGIYIGEGQFIHASSGSHKVTISDLSEDYYVRYYAGARRLLN
ncbi:C40 family peptidase [Clostridium sp. 19966]|uniref:C40 family peptidase n=1 Tax=Clostridium sp. 19966 TaxID=2768166 RepID=UPI0028DF6630|nr:C40 family peptidase [Clostridium sp. 19966]MDT8715265.1 C40 family peptidase [Clostridium sp. 19966]